MPRAKQVARWAKLLTTSVAEAVMGADQHKKRRRKGGPRFVQLFWGVLDSSAYLSLPPMARAALVEVCRRYDGSNNGRIILSVREAAERLNCNKDTAGIALG